MKKFSIFNLEFSIPVKRTGFTVLESLVAISILSLSISGVFSAVQQSLSQTIIAKDEVRAFYLAQEAIEIVRNKRDANQLNRIVNNSASGWLAGITSSCSFNRVCSVDVTNLSIADCGASWGSCSNLRQNSTNYLYNYTSGATTNLKREIQLESVNANEITVIIRISWTKGALETKEFRAKSHLFNWIP